MPRNLYNRVELVVPVEDDGIRAELLEILDLSLAGDGRRLGARCRGRVDPRACPASGERRIDIQAELIDRHTQRASEAAAP